MMDQSEGNPNVVSDLDSVGGQVAVQSLCTLVAQGRVDACAIGHWRLTVHGIGATADCSPVDEAKLLTDAILPPGQGWFKIKQLVTQKGWTYPAAIATALSLVRQDRLEEGSLGNFRLLEPEPRET